MCYVFVSLFDVLFVSVSMSSHIVSLFFLLMIRRPPRSTLDRSSAASDVYKRQDKGKEGKSLNQILDNLVVVTEDAKISASRLAENMEALKHNWLFKSYFEERGYTCLLYTSPSPRDRTRSRMPSSA